MKDISVFGKPVVAYEVKGFALYRYENQGTKMIKVAIPDENVGVVMQGYNEDKVKFVCEGGHKCIDTSENKKDEINPEHYKRDIECIEEMIMVFGKEIVYWYCVLNAWKYRYRVLQKGIPQTNIEKSDWYMKKAKELKNAKIKFLPKQDS